MYQLLMDAAGDVLAEFAKKENIHILPMTYVLGEDERVCDGIKPPDVMKWYYDGARSGLMTRTSQIAPNMYEEAFRAYAERGESLLYISLSSGLSNTYQSACLAAKNVMAAHPDVTIRCVDSLSATGGLQLLMEAAAQNRADGMSLEENAQWLECNRLDVCHWFMVTDLMYLKRNGRISPAVAAVGTALHMKPILRIENDGTLSNFEKKRGTKAALNRLIKLYEDASDKDDGERVCIMHADNQEYADYLAEGVRRVNPGSNVTTDYLSPVIGCHTGPDMCAIIHWGKRV